MDLGALPLCLQGFPLRFNKLRQLELACPCKPHPAFLSPGMEAGTPASNKKVSKARQERQQCS
jgi:hypothetical protein